MTIDPKALAAWLALPAALVAAITVMGGVIDARAQEAARAEARAQMAPAAKELSEIKDLLRRQEDREEYKLCMDYSHQDIPATAREVQCKKESDHRWQVWRWEDCEAVTPGECGAKP